MIVAEPISYDDGIYVLAVPSKDTGDGIAYGPTTEAEAENLFSVLGVPEAVVLKLTPMPS